jgi:Flp pilus assembly pilin Flp
MLSQLVRFQVQVAALGRDPRDPGDPGDPGDPRDRGATAVEYGLMVGLIAVVIIVAITFLGKQTSGMFQGVGTKI